MKMWPQWDADGFEMAEKSLVSYGKALFTPKDIESRKISNDDQPPASNMSSSSASDTSSRPKPTPKTAQPPQLSSPLAMAPINPPSTSDVSTVNGDGGSMVGGGSSATKETPAVSPHPDGGDVKGGSSAAKETPAVSPHPKGGDIEGGSSAAKETPAMLKGGSSVEKETPVVSPQMLDVNRTKGGADDLFRASSGIPSLKRPMIDSPGAILQQQQGVKSRSAEKAPSESGSLNPIHDIRYAFVPSKNNVDVNLAELLKDPKKKSMREGLEWLRNKEWGSEWDVCIRGLIEFERWHGFPSEGKRMATESRPDEYKQWIKVGRCKLVDWLVSQAFSDKWWMWWQKMKTSNDEHRMNIDEDDDTD
ncbi:hypothetical protein H0H93_006174 [Arthromyces matolae]|nr:hypothetical protein H0H93_006174 [Arthromyces matolae]